ncbi:long-chain fatty acid--CoA ligase, partial [Helicobacter muridarum]
GLGYINSDIAMLDNEGYFATGDIVQTLKVEGEEYIKIIARSKEVINIGGEKVIPQEVEKVLLQIPFIKHCIVYGEQSNIMGQMVCAKVVLDTQNLESILKTTKPLQVIPNAMEIKKFIRIFCKDKLAPYKIPTKINIVESIAISERFKTVRQ